MTSGSGVQSKRRVLIVDDDIDNARTLTQLFSVWGCKAEYAINGIVALSIAQRAEPTIRRFSSRKHLFP